MNENELEKQNPKEEVEKESEAPAGAISSCEEEAFSEAEAQEVSEEEKQPEVESLLTERDELKREIEELKNEIEELKNEVARSRADFYNFRMRVEKNHERDRVRAAEKVVELLIPVLDNLDRILETVQDESLMKGISMVQKQFLEALIKIGVKPVVSEGCLFDPSLHEAMGVEEVEEAELDGKVINELQRGYTLGGKVIRPARVRIGRLKESKQEKEDSEKRDEEKS